MAHDSQPLSVNGLAEQCRARASRPPVRRHRTTIYRTAKRLTAQAEGSSAGVYWTAEQIADWHPDDFEAIGERLSLTGVSAMAIRGELCFSCDS
ncbi:hypothetical protein [Pseudomonas mosselii]|uniref:hypothetical protein n=1 Tax=Pseudomonas mosselii TaxID=78327 RepID=UPI0021DAFB9A|nr:hypothetical protein [Pseudomonas mosselii]MCU9528066.1 hypothetical protein [Pseudomonas mosselii]MCU9535175.1 hypothetical protein [Pseudomonas mosselii]MCU9542694.1 hypothetical protein [Pseudomonas mosselii]MCU9546910.1 hypothetical protein [Pseudomonas mosselii]